MVGSFLGQPAGTGQQGPQFTLQKGVDGEVGFAHRVVHAFVPHFGRVAVPWPMRHGQAPGLVNDGFKARIIEHP